MEPLSLGGVAQLVRARGSYPRSHWFESSHRHQPFPGDVRSSPICFWHLFFSPSPLSSSHRFLQMRWDLLLRPGPFLLTSLSDLPIIAWDVFRQIRMGWKQQMTDSWLTVKEVAQYLKLSTDLIYKLAQQGKIPASKVGTAWRFKREKIDQWMESKENGPKRRNRE